MNEWLTEVEAAEFVGISVKKLVQHRRSLKHSHLIAEQRKRPELGNKLVWRYRIDGLKTHKKKMAWAERQKSMSKKKKKHTYRADDKKKDRQVKLQALIDSKPKPIIIESNAPEAWSWKDSL